MKQTLTVKEAEVIYQLKSYNIRSWIRNGFVLAKNYGSGYLIDKTSIEGYLAEKKRFPVEPENNLKSGVEPALPVAVKEESVSNQLQIPIAYKQTPPKASDPEIDPLREATAPTIGVEETPSRTEVKKQSEQGLSGNRGLKKKNKILREGRRMVKKGPVRYAKDCMRHLDFEQLRDVRDWILRRMDNKSGSGLPAA